MGTIVLNRQLLFAFVITLDRLTIGLGEGFGDHAF